jgi:hypothetical protein
MALGRFPKWDNVANKEVVERVHLTLSGIREDRF